MSATDPVEVDRERLVRFIEDVDAAPCLDVIRSGHVDTFLASQWRRGQLLCDQFVEEVGCRDGE